MLSASDHKIIAFIPARGGSKGIHKKNIYLVNDKPLISYTIDAIIESGIADEIYVSSDCDDILNVCRRYENVNGRSHEANKKKITTVSCIKRKENLALDTTTTDSVLTDFIHDISIDKSTSILLLQPTSPLRDSVHIREAVSLYLDKRPDLLMSVFTPDHSPYKSFYLNTDGYLHPIAGKDAPFMPRQALPPTYYPNGAIYLFSVDKFMQDNCIPRQNIIPFPMSSDVSIDIDTINDIYKTETILNARD